MEENDTIASPPEGTGEVVSDYPRYWLPDGVYKALKWSCLVGIPGIGVGYQMLGGIWGLPYLEEVPQTLYVVALVLGILIGVSEIKGSAGSGSSGAARRAVGGAAALALAVMMTLGCAAPALAYTEYDVMTMSGHGTISPSYLVVHSTANPGATAKNHRDYWNRIGNNGSMAHWVIDWTGTCYQMAPSDRLVYHVGYGNRYSVGIEICEATNATDFAEGFDEAARWCADFLRSRGWGVSRMVSHNEARTLWGGTDHTDPVPYFARWGKSWADFERLVQRYLDGNDPGATGTVGGEWDDDLGDLRYWGRRYTAELQEQMGTTVDGVISPQPSGVFAYVDNVEGWQRGMGGSDVVEALQTALKEAGYYHGEIDRWCGPKTIRAIQEWLEDEGYDCGPMGCNGYLGPCTNTAVGEALQDEAFVELAA